MTRVPRGIVATFAVNASLTNQHADPSASRFCPAQAGENRYVIAAISTGKLTRRTLLQHKGPRFSTHSGHRGTTPAPGEVISSGGLRRRGPLTPVSLPGSAAHTDCPPRSHLSPRMSIRRGLCRALHTGENCHVGYEPMHKGPDQEFKGPEGRACRSLLSPAAAERVSESEHDHFGDGDTFDEQEGAIGAKNA